MIRRADCAARSLLHQRSPASPRERANSVAAVARVSRRRNPPTQCGTADYAVLIRPTQAARRRSSFDQIIASARTFTAIADSMPGPEVIALLDEVFEALAAPLRPCGGQVLKFIGDGMLAIFPFDNATRGTTCRRAREAAAEAVCAVDRLNAARREASKPTVGVDFALHLGEVQYGNIGAVDRLDFTVIGPAVYQVARLEAFLGPVGWQGVGS